MMKYIKKIIALICLLMLIDYAIVGSNNTYDYSYLVKNQNDLSAGQDLIKENTGLGYSYENDDGGEWWSKTRNNNMTTEQSSSHLKTIIPAYTLEQQNILKHTDNTKYKEIDDFELEQIGSGYGLKSVKIIDTIEKEMSEYMQKAYFSPEMQYTLLSYIKKPFCLNLLTGKVGTFDEKNNELDNLPSIQDIIDYPAHNKKRITALCTALEATRIAKFIASVDIAYKNLEYAFFQPNLSSSFLIPPLEQKLLEKFNQQEKIIYEALNNTTGYSLHYALSWLPTFSINFNLFSVDHKKNHDANITYPNKLINTIVCLPEKIIEAIIFNNDYKNYKKNNSNQCANLLFKQCLIAQQSLKDDDRFFNCYDPLNQSIDDIGNSYIFNNNLNVTNLIENLQNKLTDGQITKQTIHKNFIEIRKAIHTAIYIANKQSNANFLYSVFPSIVTSYLDGTVKQLIKYDTIIDGYYKNEKYSGTKLNKYRDEMFTYITLIASGITIAGGLLTYFYGEKIANGIASAPANLTEGIYNLFISSVYGNLEKPSTQSDTIFAKDPSTQSDTNFAKDLGLISFINNQSI